MRGYLDPARVVLFVSALPRFFSVFLFYRFFFPIVWLSFSLFLSCLSCSSCACWKGCHSPRRIDDPFGVMDFKLLWDAFWSISECRGKALCEKKKTIRVKVPSKNAKVIVVFCGCKNVRAPMHRRSFVNYSTRRSSIVEPSRISKSCFVLSIYARKQKYSLVFIGYNSI